MNMFMFLDNIPRFLGQLTNNENENDPFPWSLCPTGAKNPGYCGSNSISQNALSIHPLNTYIILEYFPKVLWVGEKSPKGVEMQQV